MGRSFSQRERGRAREIILVYIYYILQFCASRAGVVKCRDSGCRSLEEKRFRRMEEVPCKLQSSRSFVA